MRVPILACLLVTFVVEGCALAHERHEAPETGQADAAVAEEADAAVPDGCGIDISVTFETEPAVHDVGGVQVFDRDQNLIAGTAAETSFNSCFPQSTGPLGLEVVTLITAQAIVNIDAAVTGTIWGYEGDAPGSGDMLNGVLVHSAPGSEFFIQVGGTHALRSTDVGPITLVAYGHYADHRLRFIELDASGHLLGSGEDDVSFTDFTLAASATAVGHQSYHVTLPDTGLLTGMHVVERSVVTCDNNVAMGAGVVGVVDMWRCTRVGLGFVGTSSATDERGDLEFALPTGATTAYLSVEIANDADDIEAWTLVPCCTDGLASPEATFRSPTLISASAGASGRGIVFSVTSDYDYAFADLVNDTDQIVLARAFSYHGGSVANATAFVSDMRPSFAGAWVGAIDTDGRAPWSDASTIHAVRRHIRWH